jgi:hypothetical protein
LSLEPPAVPVAAGRVDGACMAAVFGAGNGALCTAEVRGATEPVTSGEPRYGLASKRCVSALQPAPATEIAANRVR